MRSLILLVGLCLITGGGSANSSISKQRKPSSDEIKEYVEQEVHYIPVDRIKQVVDRKIYAIVLGRIDSLKSAVNQCH